MTSMICRSRRERFVSALRGFMVGPSSPGPDSSAKNLACAKNLAPLDSFYAAGSKRFRRETMELKFLEPKRIRLGRGTGRTQGPPLRSKLRARAAPRRARDAGAGRPGDGSRRPAGVRARARAQ